MADYQDIRGLRVKYLSADPSNPENGEVWYNSTSGTLKTQLFGGSWASGGDLNTARRALWGAGSQTAALAFGGYVSGKSGATEEYNGASWATSPGSLNTARYHLAGTGTQTAAVAFGGISPPTAIPSYLSNATENYDGSTWTTSPGTMGTGRYVVSGLGIQTAAVCFGGYPSGTATEVWNGSSWTGGNAYPTSLSGIAGCGLLAAGLGVGGSPDTTLCCEYDGTNWTAVNSANLAVNNGFASGTQTSAVLSGGSPAPNRPKTQTYDGTTWTTSGATLGTGRYSPGGTSTSGTAALSFGGGAPGNSALTEEYNFGASTKTLTTS